MFSFHTGSRTLHSWPALWPLSGAWQCHLCATTASDLPALGLLSPHQSPCLPAGPGDGP